ncbi:endonuclease/exonuclease/phosphatase family protein [Streptomyces sp. NPDC091292]|uniref:endonuclease/exonuclease/phosphatase family protein n=1 Tax=Streptomyces sp. NPDC091292 TaxID=3365991 RepID=UPI0037F7DDF7
MTQRRRTVRSLSLLAAGLLAGLTGLTGSPAQADSSVPLRVASYNLHAGSGMDNVFDLDRQEAVLRGLRADVIGLQEVDVHWGERSEWRDMAGELARRLGMHVYFAPIYSFDPPADGAPRREYGLAVLSRYKIRSAENHDLTRLSTQDPNPVPAPAPGFPEVVVKVRGVPVHVYVTHLDYRGDPSVRTAQVADTRRIMAQDCDARGKCPARILLGDFNAQPTAPELAPLWKELTAADPGGPTYPARNPTQRIDYVAVSHDTVRVRDAAVVETLASDHRPVVADLTVTRGR